MTSHGSPSTNGSDAAEQTAVRDNAETRRYEAIIDGEIAGFAQYRVFPGGILFTHTQVDPDFEGRGVGSRLARGALDDARAHDLRVRSTCPFISRYIETHPRYQDLLDPASRD